MKTVTLTAWKRPDYLQSVLDALSKADTRGYSMVAVLDHGHDPECYKLVHSVGFMPKHIVTLDTHFGVDYAGRHAIQTALGFGSEMNLALEDDTVVSPDCLNVANWWMQHPISHETVLTCFSFSQDYSRQQDLVLTDDFNSWVWGMRRGMLEQVLSQWCARGKGWDVSIRNTLRESGIKCVAPKLSRAANIGKEGVHYNPDLFAQHFHGCKTSTGLVRNYFLNT